MRLVGYCTECGHVRSIKPTAKSLALVAAEACVPSGICSECERRADEEARAHADTFQPSRGRRP